MSTKVSIDIELVTKAFNKALNDAAGQTKDFEKTAKDSFNKSTNAWDVFQGTIAANVAMKALSLVKDAASALFKTFVSDGVQAAKVQEDAINALNTSLALTGIYSKETSKDLQAFASELQNTSIYGDEAVLNNMALIQSLGNLSGSALKQATQAAADLSSALGLDLATASQLVGKAAAGEITSFKRYGISIEEGSTKAETFSNVLTALTDKFGGAAQSKTKTFSGQMQQLSNQFGDLTEITGNAVIQNEVILTVLNQVSKMFTSLSGELENTNSGLKDFIAFGVMFLIEGLKYTVIGLDYTVRGFQMLVAIVQAAVNPIKYMYDIMTVGPKEAAENLKISTEEMRSNLLAFTSEGDGSLKAFSQSLEEMGIKAAEAHARSKTGSDENALAYKNNNQLIVDSEIEKDQKLLELQQEKAISDEEWRITQDAMELQRKDAKFAQLVQDLGLEAAVRRQAEMNMTSDKSEQDKLRLQSEIDTNKKKVADYAATQKAMEAEQRKDLQNFSSFTGAMAQITALGGAKNFKITKALNIASAISSGFSAVQGALAAPPFWPLNSGSVIAAGAMAAANVARAVSQQQPRFANGGIVSGANVTGDSVMARVNSGEMVLNKGQQANLFSMANGSYGNNGKIEGLLSELINAVRMAGHTSIQIDGREIVGVVRDQLNLGRAF